MRHDVERRLAVLEEALKLRKLAQSEPVDDLSQSLFDMGRELAALDEQGKAALLYKLNHGDPLDGTMGLNLSMEDLERFIADYTEV